jgi:hypothetical protein
MRLTALYAPWFKRVGYPLAKVRVSCGWPVGRALAGTKSRTVGQCWPPQASMDNTTELFISPYLSCGYEVGHTLLHELVHAAIGCKHGHDQTFRNVATKLGLTGKMTATVAGPELTEKMKVILDKLGHYPHATLDMSKRKKQGTRLVKASCGLCEYTIRITRKWIDELGLPNCPGCGDPLEEAV